MLNFCLRDSFIELFHCNRHFSMKGKSGVTFPNFPSPRVIEFLESLSIFTCTFCSRGISRYEFVTAISEELIDFVSFFICKWSNLSFSHSVWRHSWWKFSWFCFGTRQFFFGYLFFFSWTSSSWAFFLICFISSLFRLLRVSLWHLFASSGLFQLKKCRK